MHPWFLFKILWRSFVLKTKQNKVALLPLAIKVRETEARESQIKTNPIINKQNFWENAKTKKVKPNREYLLQKFLVNFGKYTE